MLFACHVKLQAQLGIEANAEIVVHHRFLVVQLSFNLRNKTECPYQRTKKENTTYKMGSFTTGGVIGAHKASALNSNACPMKPNGTLPVKCGID
jgi:hypothetical protein